MTAPFLSIVIPTRERADTLRYALKSCIAQPFRDAEFIVSNNASTDETEAVVQSFDDPRIKLINPGRRVSMRENWEFALQSVTGRFVTYIGDDDALMPDALGRLAKLLSARTADAVKWQAPTYYWPQSGHPLSGKLALNLGNRAAPVKSAAALNAVRWGYLYYHFLPMIYHGAVSMECISRIRAKSGEFFCCEIPDIYSGVAVAASTQEYVYLQTPLTISGASRHSNGTSSKRSSSVQKNTPASLFFSENTLGPHPDFVALAEVPSSIHACVTDAMLRARDKLQGGSLYVPLWYRLMLIVREIAAQPNADVTAPDHPLSVYSRKRNLGWLYDYYAGLFVRHAPRPDVVDIENDSKRPAGVYLIDTEQLGAGEVYEASVLLDKLLQCVDTSWSGSRVATRSLLSGRILSKLSQNGSLYLFNAASLS
jgi:glycosyltransferase involved in cell wall biosynthesis